jgi:palmitoyl transferase
MRFTNMVRQTVYVFRRLVIVCFSATILAGTALADEAAATSATPVPAPESPPWYERAFKRLETTWDEGTTELYLPLHTYHLRSAYSKEKIDSFNESPWGLGLGKGTYDPDGDWHGIFAMEFQDSHYKPEYVLGYGYKTFWPIYDELKFGLGYVAFVTTRSDWGHYTPVPAALPMITLEYRKFSFDTIYVPGGKGNGNVLLFWGKYHF